MLKLRYMYQIPAVVEIRAPHSHERVHWDVQGWWSFYEFAFEAGFRFPIPRLCEIGSFSLSNCPQSADAQLLKSFDDFGVHQHEARDRVRFGGDVVHLLLAGARP